MCGIVGAFAPSRRASSEHLSVVVGRMSDRLIHRGPDDGGLWADEESGVALGHRRLSIVDLTAEGRQPMHASGGRYAIVFNGEIYNFEDLRKDLINEDPSLRFRGTSDTEVMLAAFSKWGISKSLKSFNGMFAFALWDRQERRLFLGRDRLGEKPLYYGWVGGIFVFGSELKALRAVPGGDCELDRKSLALYMRYSCVPSPRSIYRGIYKLPPGCLLTLTADQAAGTDGFSPYSLPSWSGGKWGPVPYWSASRAVVDGISRPFVGSAQDARAALQPLLADAVKLRMRADVPLGAFLSGGIDSSTIVALMQAQSARPVKTFTIGFGEDSYDEADWARAVARRLGTDHSELYVTAQDAMAVIPLLPQIYDEPFADASQIPTFLVSRATRAHVTVALTGDGGDELFGGYTRYLRGQEIWSKVGWIPPSARKLLARILRIGSPETWDRCTPFLMPFLSRNGAQGSIGDMVYKTADVLDLKDFDGLYRRLVSEWQFPSAVVRGATDSVEEGWGVGTPNTVLSPAQKMMFYDLSGYLPDDILVKVDRASMAVSLEGRVPFLDHRVVEFAWSLPLSQNMSGGEGKRVLRAILGQTLPQELIQRPKMGFALPIDSWLRGPLRDWAESLLGERRLRDEGFFDPDPVRRMWSEHQAGRRNWHGKLWCVLMFQAWLESETSRRRDESSGVIRRYAA